MIQTAEMQQWLRAIVSQEPWNEDELAGWANEFLTLYEDEFWKRRKEERLREERARIKALMLLVSTYQPDPALPALPRSPDGQLHGIGFIYDEDRDDRVLIAIDRLKHDGGIVAVAEHEGELTVYTHKSIGERNVEVCGDTWLITEFVPSDGHWSKVRPKWLDFDLSEFQK